MRILQIFPGKVWGGAEQYVLDLSHHLEQAGHSVTYVARKSQAVAARLGREGLACHYMGLHGLWDVASLRALMPLLREHDVVHIHDVCFVPLVAAACRLCGCRPRIVLTRHIARASRTMPWARLWFKSLHNIIFVSDLAMRLWRGGNSWFPAERCRVVINSIPTVPRCDADGSLRSLYGIAPDVPLLMFTGRVRKSKGCEVIVRALGELRSLPFAMVFVGACKPKGYAAILARVANELGIADRIHFHGFATDVRRLIQEADIGLAPSVVREACPLSPMEFMQAGKCVVATDNGAQPEYITHGVSGMLVPPADAKALAGTLGKLLTDMEATRAIGRSAQSHFMHDMDYGCFVNKIISAYS